MLAFAKMTNVETTVTSILDVVPSLRKVKLRRYLTITTTCIVYFLLGFTFTLTTGTYWIEIIDSYSGGWAGKSLIYLSSAQSSFNLII